MLNKLKIKPKHRFWFHTALLKKYKGPLFVFLPLQPAFLCASSLFSFGICSQVNSAVQDGIMWLHTIRKYLF